MTASARSAAVQVWPGWVMVDEVVYHQLADLAGTDLATRWPHPVSMPVGPSSLPDPWPAAVYVAINTAGMACYVGKFARPGSGPRAGRARFAEHLRSVSKAAEWCAVYVIPVREDVAPGALAALEAAVARRLGVSVRNGTWRRRESVRYR